MNYGECGNSGKRRKKEMPEGNMEEEGEEGTRW
jgi:hypothetical protein